MRHSRTSIIERVAIGVLSAVAVAALARPATAAEAQKHALLIAVGNYLYDVPSLEGPPHDAAALKRLLSEKWGFPAANIKTLVDGQATRAAILAALDGLATTTRPGDYVFIYYSGHGTSSYDRRDLGLDNNTGALVPADVKRTDPHIMDSLIVGSRDLRPRLEKIDRDRKVLAIFDSCYSAAAVRSVRAMGRSRFLEMPPVTGAVRPSASEAPPSVPAPYPYQNVVYISASSQSEAAIDITRSEIDKGVFATVDGQPHGALTNFLLDGLGGSADLDRNGSLTYRELYSFLRDKVSESFPHQPQLLAPEARTETLLQTPVFDQTAPRSASAGSPAARPVPAAPLRVRLEGLAAPLVRDIRKMADVRLVEGRDYDVLLAQDASGLRLFHRSGDVLASFGPGDAAAAKERLQQQIAVRSLLDLKFLDQDFGATVSIPGRRGFLTSGDAFAIDVVADHDSVFLLLDVDTSGHVSVLYPFSEAELVPRRTVRVPALPDQLRVSPPFGTEYLRLFAFRERPRGIERWLKAGFPASDPKLRELLDWLRATSGSRASDRLKVVTRESAS